MKKTMTLLGLLLFVAGVYAQKVPAKAKKEKTVTVTTKRTPQKVTQSKTQGPPSWAPAHGYRAKTRHVYFPTYNFYFDLRRNVYIYLRGGTWQVSATMPSLFVNIDLKRAVKVELELDTDRPQRYNARHKKMHNKR